MAPTMRGWRWCRAAHVFKFTIGLLVLVDSGDALDACSEVARTYGQLGYNPTDVPAYAVSGKSLQICPQPSTCCTAQVETNLAVGAHTWLSNSVAGITLASRETLFTRSAKMDEFFLQLLTRGQRELNDMFVRAYGAQYVQNADVFERLFRGFLDYYKGGSVDLADTMRSFFAEIFARMFQMLNAAHSLDATYLRRCVYSQLGAVRPFGDAPDTLARNVKQAFVAVRTFIQGLAAGRNVLVEATMVKLTASCSRAIARMLFCPKCSSAGGNSATARPCQSYCLREVQSCLAQLHQLGDSWDTYLDAMDELAARLENEGAFNVESVMGPLKDLISTAIMDYNDHHQEITEKVFSSPGCAIMRGSSSRGFNGGTVHRDKRQAHSQSARASSSSSSSSVARPAVAWTLDRLVRDARARLKQLRGLWGASFDDQMCRYVAAPASDSGRCWDGRHDVSDKRGDGVAFNGTELSIETANQVNPVVANATSLLRQMTVYLNSAVGDQKHVAWLRLETPTNTHKSVELDAEDGSGMGTPLHRGNAGSGDNQWRQQRPSPSHGSDEEDDGSGVGKTWPKSSVSSGQGARRPEPRPVPPQGGGGHWDDDEDDDDGDSSGSGGGTGGDVQATMASEKVAVWQPPAIETLSGGSRATPQKRPQSASSGSAQGLVGELCLAVACATSVLLRWPLLP